jgi:peroxiredoxin
MEYVTIGPLQVPLKWIFIGVSMNFSILILNVYLRKKGMEHKQIVDDLWNGLFIFIIVWKLSLIIFEPKLVANSPLSLLYFTGGVKGIWLGFAISLLYTIIQFRKINIPKIVILHILSIFGITIFGMYQLISITTGTEFFLRLVSGLGAIVLSIVFMKPSVKQLKTFIIMAFLLGLMVWTVYDHFDEKNQPLTADGVQITASTETGLKVGNQAPDFELTTLDGTKVKLSDYRGKKVILNFWATWCPPCKAEMPHMQDFYEENNNGNVEIVAVNLRNSEKSDGVVNQFIADYQITFPILLDTNAIGDLYQAFTIPTSYAIDSKGIIHYRFVGPLSKERMENMINSMN